MKRFAFLGGGTVALFVGATALVLAGPGQPLETNINNFYLRGTQPGDLAPGNEIITATDECIGCHHDEIVVPIYRQWSGNIMAHAARDPLMWACLDIANADAPQSGDLCIRCHVPKAWLEGRSLPTDGSAVEPYDRDSITCNFCHRLVDPYNIGGSAPSIDAQILTDLGGDAPIMAMDRGTPSSPGFNGNGGYVVDPYDRRRGPFPVAHNEDPIPPLVNCEPFHFATTYGNCDDGMGGPTGCGTFESPMHRRSDLCGTCHDVSLPHFSYNKAGTALVFNGAGLAHPTGNRYDMAPEQRTFSEWLKSDFASGGVNMGTRYGCNNQVVSECQDCHMPAQTAQGCGFSPERNDIPTHDFRGAATWVLDAIATHYGPNGPLPGYPPPSPGGPDFYEDVEANLHAQKQTNIAKGLACAADLDVTLDDSQSPGTDKLRVRVINQTGHKLPTGYPEGRRMWITVEFFDCTDYSTPMQVLGGYDQETAHLDENTTKVYEMKAGLDEALALALNRPAGISSHAILANKVYKDNRIPPRGFSNLKFAAIQAEPVAYSYADGQYWDDTYFDIPAYAVRARVSLYYQATSKEYIEFLRDNNPNPGNPQNRGQFAYDMWLAHGKSAPVKMAAYPPPVWPDCKVDPNPDYPCGNPAAAHGAMNVELKGDVNGNRSVTVDDIPGFVQVLLGADTDPRRICAADMDDSDAADGLDVAGFVDALLAP